MQTPHYRSLQILSIISKFFVNLRQIRISLFLMLLLGATFSPVLWAADAPVEVLNFNATTLFSKIKSCVHVISELGELRERVDELRNSGALSSEARAEIRNRLARERRNAKWDWKPSLRKARLVKRFANAPGRVLLEGSFNEVCWKSEQFPNGNFTSDELLENLCKGRIFPHYLIDLQLKRLAWLIVSGGPLEEFELIGLSSEGSRSRWTIPVQEARSMMLDPVWLNRHFFPNLMAETEGIRLIEFADGNDTPETRLFRIYLKAGEPVIFYYQYHEDRFLVGRLN